MKNITRLTLAFLLLPNFLISQNDEINPDTICIFMNDPQPFSVVENDPYFMMTGEAPKFCEDFQSECVRLTSNGILTLISDNEMCCGSFEIPYGYKDCTVVSAIYLTIKCEEPKPECSIINLDDYKNYNSEPNGNKSLIHACDSNSVIYYVSELPGYSYSWDLAGIPFTTLGSGEIEVLWPGTGSYSMVLTESNGSNTNTYTFCIEVLESPSANFEIINDCGCLNSPVSFTNTSIGGNDFFWDFGDGNFSSDFSATHTYTSPGIYDVTLYVTQDNFSKDGSPLCCCTDSIVQQIKIEPLEGPEIFCISTLCEGDSTKYWTDAENCDYNWSAMDASGNAVSIIGSTTSDTICIVWEEGPFGIVTLEVDNCDEDFCEQPVSAIIPIIQDTSQIVGDDVVCAYSFNYYSLPKWPSVEYEWSIDPVGIGAIVSGQGTNSIVIDWYAAPNSAIINVSYYSDFLGGLPNHSQSDCAGIASLEIDILPEYDLISPSTKFCIDDMLTFSTTIPSINGFTWEVYPSPGVITGLGNTPLNISFSNSGSYEVIVYPNFPNPFCNDTLRQIIEILEVPLADSITGPKEICPNETHTYFGHTSTNNTLMEWFVEGGSFTSGNLGNPVTVDWGVSGPYKIGLRQILQSNPMCPSDTIFCSISEKELLPPTSITSSVNCVNEVQSYTVLPAQHGDAYFDWSVSPPASGSIIDGNGSPNIDIQWNNTPGIVTITCIITLCDDNYTIMETINLNKATIPNITQSGFLCPGGNASLDAGSGYINYDWSPGGSGNPLSISSPGNYIVTVTDMNGCTAVNNFEAVEHALPIVGISTPDILPLCVGTGGTVEIHGLDGGVSIEWFKNGVSQGPGSPDPAIITHTNTNVVASFTYYYIATDLVTGCTNQSDNLVVNQVICGGGSGGCTPESYTLDVTNTNLMPICNEVEFMVSSTNVTPVGWNFGDPSVTSYTGTVTNPIVTYDEAGYYVATFSGTVPEDGSTSNCAISDTTAVCVPLAADFEFESECGVYTFTDNSSFITGADITMWSWDFGDMLGTSSMTNPMYSYSSSGTFMVTLTVENANGCTASITKPVTVAPDPTPIIDIIPGSACVGEPFIFTNLNNTGIVDWLWNFGDGSDNGGSSPSHAYTSDGPYTVTLTVTNENGCTGMATSSLTVFPLPTPGNITYSPDLFICSGESVDLTAPPGSSWVWNTTEITQTITASMAGYYSVTITDANNCVYSPDSVEVIVYPEIDANIYGNPVICDDECTTLYAAQAAGYIYYWHDQDGNLIGTNQSIDICFGSGVTEVYLKVEDANGCLGYSPTILIAYETSPTVNISPSVPIPCEGVPTVLTITPYDPALDYLWSTGSSAPSITVIAAGPYSVVATDPLTGCSSFATITVYPAPDLCIIPGGCYTACDPDTICAPDGLTDYQWFLNGTLISSANGQQCLEVTESGAYHFTGTNNFGCSSSSDTLHMEIIPCCYPEDTNITAEPIEGDGDCCFSLSYDIDVSFLYGISIHSPNANLNIDFGSIHSSLQVTSSSPSIILNNSSPTDPIYQGYLPDFGKICVEDPTNQPTIVVIDWLDMNSDVLCSDTLQLECPVEPDCIYIVQDEIFCEDDVVYYNFEVCNPLDADFSVGFIDLIDVSPAGLVVTPDNFDLITPLDPGDCISLSITLSGSSIANEMFCFNLIGHEINPQEDPSALCCSTDTTYCIQIPGCHPCDMVYVSDIIVDPIDSCCYDIQVINNATEFELTGIGICALTPDVSLGISNPIGSQWTTVYLDDKSGIFDYTDDDLLPNGSHILPKICIEESPVAFIDIAVKWMVGEDIKCEDTISLFCPGDCGYIEPDYLITCHEEGGWKFTGYIVNTSTDTMNSAYIDFGNDALDPYDQSISLNGLAPGEIYGPFSIYIGPEAHSGEELCIITTLHASNHGDEHEDCCEFKTIIILPECENDELCICDASFEEEIAKGILCDFTGEPLAYEFSPAGNFTECDKIEWKWGDGTPNSVTVGNQSITHIFPEPGEYEVCMTVYRVDIYGNECKERVCKQIEISEQEQIMAYPIPAYQLLNISLTNSRFSGDAHIIIYDTANKEVLRITSKISSEENAEIDISHLNKGIYFVIIELENKTVIKRIIIMR